VTWRRRQDPRGNRPGALSRGRWVRPADRADGGKPNHQADAHAV